jgi:GT2 family glycosyltransferase
LTDQVHAVVVAFHAPDQLDRCLAALGRQLETTVVDNSSSAVVEEIVLRYRAEYVDPGRNLGFSAGVNQALEHSLRRSPKDVLLLNPDARLEPEELEKLVLHMHRPGNERLAAVAPRLVGSGGNEQRVLWPFPTPVRAWADAVGLGHLPARAAFLIGAVLLLRREALLDVGIFDERFFLYAEEADWQRRALARGWTTELCQEAVGFHAGAGTTADPVRRETLFHAAQETYIRKWHGSAGWSVYRCAACAGAAVRALVLAGDRRAEALRRTQLYAKGPTRCARAARS